MALTKLSKEKILEIYKFVMWKRKELNFGQRKLRRLIEKEFSIKLSEATLSGWIFKNNVPFANEKTQFKSKTRPDKETLFKLYFKQKVSPDEIAKVYAVTDNTVRKWIRDYGAKTRTIIESMKSEYTKSKLREKKLKRPLKIYNTMSPEKAYILGVLCGDGHINQDYVRFEIRNDEEFVKEFVRCFEEVYGLRYNYKYL